LPAAPAVPKEHDEVLKRMVPYLRAHLRKMYARSAANGMTEYMHAAMLLDNIALDDYRSQYEKTLNHQAPPLPAAPRGPRRNVRTQLSADERAQIRELTIRAKLSAKDPAVIAAVMAERES
jgi:hypothetical protein